VFDAGTRQVVSRRKARNPASNDDNPCVVHWPLAPVPWPLSLKFEFADDFDAGLHVIDRSLGQNSVAEVEDVAGTRASALEQFMHAHAQLGERRHQHRWIQVALHRGTIADIHPGLVDIDAPVDAHYVAAGRVQFLEEACRAGSEVDHGHARRANALDQRARIRRHVANIIVRAERADPAIEYLNDARARRDLQYREGSQHVYQLAHQATPQRLVLVHHFLGTQEISRHPRLRSCSSP